MTAPRVPAPALVVVLVLLAVSCSATEGPAATPSPEPSGVTVASSDPAAPTPTRPTARPPSPVPPVVGDLDAALALGVATRLATDIGVRTSGSDADRRAVQVIAGYLAATGWTVAVESVPLPQGGETANVVAWQGDDPRGGPHVVVGGHLDTVPGSPGGNDNASGIGVLVAIADELADEDVGSLVLVAFGAEEFQPGGRHHLGSAAYTAAHGAQVTAMVSVDMLGNGDSTCLCWFTGGPSDLASELHALTGGGFHVAGRGDISDHGPFARLGIPAVLLWTGRDGRYHSPRDTAEHLRPADLARAGNLVLAWLRGRAS